MISRHSRTISLTIFVVLMFSVTAFAQSSIDANRERLERMELERYRRNQIELVRRENEERMSEGKAELKRMKNPNYDPLAPLLPPKSLVFKPKSEDKRLLEPSPEDKKAYAIFLNQPDTGLFRLIPPTEDFNSVDKMYKYLFTEFSSRYSFSKLRNGADGWAEIRLEEDGLRVGVSKLSIGMLTLLGDTPLEAVRLSSPNIVELDRFIPSSDYAESFNQYKQSREGFTVGEYKYGASMPVLLNTTYALRSASYDRADILVVFRVIRRDDDGKLTILWKKLKTYPLQTLRNRPK